VGLWILLERFTAVREEFVFLRSFTFINWTEFYWYPM